MRKTKGICFKVMAAAMALILLAGFFGPLPVKAADSVMTQLLQDVSPKGMVSLTSGKTLELRALAVSGAQVVANLNGQTIPLTATSKKENGGVWYTADYTAPSSSQDVDMGQIRFSATKDGRTETRAGGMVQLVVPSQHTTVDRPPNSGGNTTDLGNVPAASGDIIRITKEYADIFSSVDRGEDYAAPYYYNLPAGTMDYVVGTTSASYILKSGRRVSQGNATKVKTGTNGNSTVSGVTITADSTYTTIAIKQSWAVPFNITPSPLTYSGSGNTVSSCNPTSIVLTLDYTSKFLPAVVALPRGGAFQKVDWELAMNGDIPQLRMTLTLSQRGGYYGAYASYDSNGTLTLRFLNPVTSLQGARIVIDPGHGSGDPGNTGSGINEADVNIQQARALKEELESRGAKVYLLETRSGTYVGLYERVDMAIDWEPHIYIAVHENWADNRSARGVETYYNNPYSQRLAQYINNELYGAYREISYSSGAQNRGHKFSEFAVTRVKQFAAVLVEYGFMSNSQELELVTNPICQWRFAEATADGIERFLSGQ